MNDFNPQGSKSGSGHEHKDIDPIAIGLVVLVLVLAGGFLMLGVGVFVGILQRQSAPVDKTTSLQAGRSDFPRPQLQVSPTEDLRQLNQRAEQRLKTYGWIDREHGIVRIPIDRAMEVLAERGLPRTGRQVTRLDLMQNRPATPPGSSSPSPTGETQ